MVVLTDKAVSEPMKSRAVKKLHKRIKKLQKNCKLLNFGNARIYLPFLQSHTFRYIRTSSIIGRGSFYSFWGRGDFLRKSSFLTGILKGPFSFFRCESKCRSECTLIKIRDLLRSRQLVSIKRDF